MKARRVHHWNRKITKKGTFGKSLLCYYQILINDSSWSGGRRKKLIPLVRLERVPRSRSAREKEAVSRKKARKGLCREGVPWWRLNIEGEAEIPAAGTSLGSKPRGSASNKNRYSFWEKVSE